MVPDSESGLGYWIELEGVAVGGRCGPGLGRGLGSRQRELGDAMRSICVRLHLESKPT